MQQVLRWEYGWSTLSDKKIQKKSSGNILIFWKIIILYLWQAVFFVFSLHFMIEPISYRKSYFKILEVYISVKRALEKLHLHRQWGPDPHNSPHQRGAVSKAEQAIFVQKNELKTIKSYSIFDLIKYLITSLIINYYIQWGSTFYYRS